MHQAHPSSITIPASASALLACARAAGLHLTATEEDLDTSGLDFVVLRAVDAGGIAWIVRAPRREAAARAAVTESRVLRLVAPRLAVAVPAWRVHTPDVIAYPLLSGTPAVTVGAEGPSWHVIDPASPSSIFLDTMAAALTALMTTPEEALVAAGVPRVPVVEARAEIARAVETTRAELAPSEEIYARWQRWLADDRLWPTHTALVHGDLHPGHMLLGEDGALVGILDWTEAKVTDPSVDLAMFFGAFGERALDELLARMSRAGAPVSPMLARHAQERWCAFPALVAEWALRTGSDAVLAHAKGLLGLGAPRGMMGPSPVIRDFEPGDLPAMQDVRRAAFEPVFRSFREIVGPEIAAVAFAHADAEQAKLLDDICASGSAHHVRVAALDDGIVVGFVSFTVDAAKRTSEIGLTAVHPAHAGRGLGTRMINEALGRMKELGAAIAAVGTGGDPSHAPARRAYEKAGFGPALPSVYLYKLL